LKPPPVPLVGVFNLSLKDGTMVDQANSVSDKGVDLDFGQITGLSIIDQEM